MHSSSPSFFFFLVGWDLRHQVLRPLLAYSTAPDDRWGWLWSNWWNKDWQGKPKYSEKTCPSAILSTTNPTWPDPCANTGRRGGKSATNSLSYGAAPLHSCYMPCPSHPPWLDHSIYTWRRVQVMKILIMQFSERQIYYYYSWHQSHEPLQLDCIVVNV
jgi:hypothetical protein